jgi:hypothetical protein
MADKKHRTRAKIISIKTGTTGTTATRDTKINDWQGKYHLSAAYVFLNSQRLYSDIIL